MGEVKEFKLPDLGEGLTEGDILRWLVAVGDCVAVNDSIAEVETVKAAVELPSPYAGVVTALHAAEGETVPVGAPIISIDVEPGESPDAPDTAADDEREPTLVGYGPQEGRGRRRRRAPRLPATSSAQTAFNVPPPGVSPPEPPAPPAAAPLPEPEVGAAAAPGRPRAKPPVRKLAKTLGVDLDQVPATGPNGSVSRDDVQAAAGRAGSATAPQQERETRVPVKGVRKHTAAAMVASAFTAPHVTEFITVDVSAMMELRDRVASRPEFRDVKVSPLLFLAKAVILAVRRTPEINATWDEQTGEIVYKHYVNLGIAAATDRGLIVPNIKDADRMTLRELAGALGALTDTARAGKTPPEDMAGGTITITNVGVFGVDTGTPILNPGEAGIVAFGAVRRMPWVCGGTPGGGGVAAGGGAGNAERIEPRWVSQLAVSFDHRVVDGQQGSRFLADVAAVLSDPGMALL